MTAVDENVKSFSMIADSSVGVFTGPPGIPGSASPNSGLQYRAVKVTGRMQVGKCGVGDPIFGILYNKPQATGAPATVAYQGLVVCEAGGTVAVNDIVHADANGRLVTGVAVAGGLTLRAVTAAAATGQLFTARIV